MNDDLLLTIALDVLYLGVFAITLLDYLRRPSPVRRSVVAVFGSLAITFVVQIARALVPAIPPFVTTVSSAFLLAQPVLVLWLIRHFRPLSNRLLGAAAAVYAISTASLILGGSGNRVSIVAIVGYFVAVEVLAAILIGLEARRRAGPSRSRLALAAVATALFGAAVLVAGASAATSGGSAAQIVIALARLLALVAALGYLAAFAPPRPLRNLSQQATAYGFIRELGRLPGGTPPSEIWGLLARVAQSVTAATGAAVAVPAADGGSVVATSGSWPLDPNGIPIRPSALRDSAGRPPIVLPIVSDGHEAGELALLVTGSPLFVEDDMDLLRLLASRAAQQVEREQVMVDLRRASEAKSDFLAAMSHELRTPLNSIIGFSELLLENGRGSDTETVARFSDHIHASGLHLLELINDVLDLAKVEAGRLDIQVTPFDLRALVVQTAETMQPLADRKSIRLELPPPGVIEIEADASRIRQVIYNLLSNAVKFTPENGRVSIGLVTGDDHVELSVTDTGPGIASSDQARVFEAFQQVTSTAARLEGTGLGLALTRQLVERHGGTIRLESTVGEGSRFIVLLPTRATASVTSPRPEAPQAGGGPVVVVIEDDQRAAELLRHYLEDAGHNVVVAHDATSGIARANDLHPAAILLDILLPDIDGWEVLQRLKGNPRTRDIPVLVVSVVDDAQLGLALGAVDYFVKPVARDDLLAALGRLTFTTKVRTRTVSVLAIDSDPAAAERYSGILGPDGFVVTTVATGEAGLAAARTQAPDLILLELILPDLDGYEVVTRLKADPATANIPIWVATRGTLTAEEKSRLNGKVLGVAERGDAALTALQHWLDRMATKAAG